MMAPSKISMAGVLAVLAAAPLVNAHGYMSVPKTTFSISGDPTQFCATMDGPTTLTAPSGMSFTTDPASNTKAFTAALKASTYKSMRALVDAKGQFISGANKECGVTSPTGDKQPLPAQYVEWAHSSTEGFTPSHQGPCEVWCDNNLAFSDENCATNYPTAPAKLPYDKTKCTGASMLKIYWLALHSSTWQAYINCAPLEGGSGSSSSTTPAVTPASASASGSADDEADETATTPAVTPAPASESSYDDEYATTPAPAASSSSGSEDCDDELDIADSASGSIGAEEDCDDELDIADSGSEDCDDELDIAGSDSTAPSSSTTTAPSTDDDEYATSAPATTTTAPSSDTSYDDEYATPEPASDSDSTGEVGGDADTEVGADADDEYATTPAPAASGDDEYATTPAPAASGDDEYATTPAPAAASASSGSEDCDDELDIADSASGSEDCDDELDIAGSDSTAAPTTAPTTTAPSTGSVGADEDCDDELDIAGSEEDCDDELDIAGSSEGSEGVKTSDLDFSSISAADSSEVGTVDAY